METLYHKEKALPNSRTIWNLVYIGEGDEEKAKRLRGCCKYSTRILGTTHPSAGGCNHWIWNPFIPRPPAPPATPSRGGSVFRWASCFRCLELWAGNVPRWRRRFHRWICRPGPATVSESIRDKLVGLMNLAPPDWCRTELSARLHMGFKAVVSDLGPCCIKLYRTVKLIWKWSH